MSSSRPSVPRLKDVARSAGVSIGTASRILNGDTDSFSEQTCAKVVEKACELGWRRNLLVDGIQKGRTFTIGVLVPPHDSFWVAVLAGIHLELTAADYLPITTWIGDCRTIPAVKGNEQAGLDQINRLLDRRVDALILWPSFAVAYYEHYKELMERKIPVVVIDHRLSTENIADLVESDDGLGARLVAEHLLKLGHKHIACLSTRELDWQAWSTRRREEFEKEVQRIGGAEVQSWKSDANEDEILDEATRILTSEPRPTAIFAVSDHLARQVYRAASALGVRIPEDVSVVGFADLDFSVDLWPPLTTVHQHAEDIGRAAAKAVLDRLNGVVEVASPARDIRLPVTLMDRKSTAAVAR